MTSITKRDVEVALADHKQKLNFEWQGDCVIIKKPYDPTPKGRQEWEQIMTIVRTELDGKWVSLKQDSHWIVPLEVEEQQEQQPKLANNGTYGSLHCPYCGKRIEITFKPEKGASQTD